ncbi:hypothetical protein ACGFOU_01940 [Streptomyces sp. NPDC048595]|uniref:hypothetical protein n=1 Tax=Streptomyces sp. NPDC048595 TaxID=3365576 RepID=UPI00371E4ED4
MKTYIGHHQVLTDTDALELALGTPLELRIGEKDESEQERAARLDAARDILTNTPDLYGRALHTAAVAVLDDRIRHMDGVAGVRRITTVPTTRAAVRRFPCETAVAA